MIKVMDKEDGERVSWDCKEGATREDYLYGQ